MLDEEFPFAEELEELAKLSDLAYHVNGLDSEQLRNHPELTGHVWYENKVDMELLIVSNTTKKYIALIYRGTDSPTDIMKDIMIRRVRFHRNDEDLQRSDHSPPSNVRVHKGFNSSFFPCKDMRIGLEKVMNEFPSYKVFITGHSLGAAVAILASAYMANVRPDKNFICINFGCPRVGNQAFKDWVEGLPNLAVWRCVHEDDVVARIPPEVFGYRHTGHMFELCTNVGNIYFHHYGDRKRGFAAPMGSKWNQIPDSKHYLKDHATAGYIDYFVSNVAQNEAIFYPKRFLRIGRIRTKNGHCDLKELDDEYHV